VSRTRAIYRRDMSSRNVLFGSGTTAAPRTSRFLHVANGTSTTMTIEAAGIPGAVSIWADPLHDGPVPAGLSDDELIAVRGYLPGPDDPPPDPVIDVRNWRAVIERQDAYDELILWYEHDLFDQLNLVQLLTWIREHVPTAVVSLICIGSFPGRPNFHGLGELTPAELATLLDTRLPVVDAQYDLAARTWRAFREPTPEPLDALRRSDTSALPFLSASITRFLQDYPWTTDGLSRTERRLLELAAGGPIDLHKIFPRMHDGEYSYYVSDMSLADLVESLSSAVPPLLGLTTAHEDDLRRLRGSVQVTEAGRAVLDGREDRVARCGIDRWLGGVHLQGRANLWRWDPQHDRIVRSP
jgi:hypothetical protein